MKVGINYPWSYNQFGAQIGPYPNMPVDRWKAEQKLVEAGQPVPPPPLFDHIDANLSYLKDIGVSVVRWFLLGDGFNYGPASQPAFKPGHTTPVRAFDPPARIDSRFVRDFEHLLDCFKGAKLQIIPSLISFGFGSSITYTVDSERGIGSGGKADVITDKNKQKLFFDTLLNSLLDVSTKYREQICAWEVINEPIWLCQGYGALSKPAAWIGRVPEVTFSQMRAFLTEGLKRIDSFNFKSTVGHRYKADLERFPTGSLPQFHYYAKLQWYAIGPLKDDPPGIRAQSLFKSDPKPILGEFDTDENRFGLPWAKDLGQRNSTLERLKLLRDEGCELALLWPDYAPDDSAVIGSAKIDKTLFKEEREIEVAYDIVKLLAGARRAIAQFTNSTPPTNMEWVRDNRCGTTQNCNDRIAKSVGTK